MSNGNFKHDLFTEFTRAERALSNANRLEFLEYLAQGEHCANGLAEVSGLTAANTSQQLQQLRHAGLVVCHKDGLKMSLNVNDVITLFHALRCVAERHLVDVEKRVNTNQTVKDNLETLPFQERLERIQYGLVTVLDVRLPEDYAAGHVAGVQVSQS
jgi:DNA-binding transcriptional ArsR family regulator